MQKILYVDDETINLQLFKINFGKKYEVLIAENAMIGLEILNNYPDISVVISDMKMPEMNGIEFIKKSKVKFPDKNYFILTGYDISIEIQEAINVGLIIKCFKKPFNKSEIDSEIELTIK